jgi:predicted lipid-binding transport protein (Tim44 family)
MHAASGFPIDLVLFGMIAAFLVLRLRSPVIDIHADAPSSAPGRPLPDPASDVGKTLLAIQAIDKKFDTAHFLAGAEQAFKLIVTAFAAGDRARLRPLLSPEIFTAFDGAISARELAGHTQRTEIREILEAVIQGAALHGSVAEISVHFVSHQLNVTLDRDRAPVAGMDAITEIADLWRFTRDVRASDLAWRLSEAHNA